MAGLTADNPYAGGTQKITNYLADPAEMAILHMVNADPARTPTFALFAKPDYFFSPGPADCGGGACVTQNTGFAWDHGDYAAEINTNYVGLRRPRRQAPRPGRPGTGHRAELGLAEQRPGRSGRQRHHRHLGRRDRHPADPDLPDRPEGRLRARRPGHHRDPVQPEPRARRAGRGRLGACYKQLNSSVGQFGNFTLQASTAAVESSTSGDAEYRTVNAALAGLDRLRDSLGLRVKGELEAAAFGDHPVIGAAGQTAACKGIIAAAGALAKHL